MTTTSKGKKLWCKFTLGIALWIIIYVTDNSIYPIFKFKQYKNANIGNLVCKGKTLFRQVLDRFHILQTHSTSKCSVSKGKASYGEAAIYPVSQVTSQCGYLQFFSLEIIKY